VGGFIIGVDEDVAAQDPQFRERCQAAGNHASAESPVSVCGQNGEMVQTPAAAIVPAQDSPYDSLIDFGNQTEAGIAHQISPHLLVRIRFVQADTCGLQPDFYNRRQIGFSVIGRIEASTIPPRNSAALGEFDRNVAQDSADTQWFANPRDSLPDCSLPVDH
jgi:hypothetical protein